MTIEEKYKPLDRIGAGIRNGHKRAHTKNDTMGSVKGHYVYQGNNLVDRKQF